MFRCKNNELVVVNRVDVRKFLLQLANFIKYFNKCFENSKNYYICDGFFTRINTHET